MAGRYDRVNGAFNKVRKRYDKVNGIWQPVKKRYVKANGAWEKSYASSVPVTLLNIYADSTSDFGHYWPKVDTSNSTDQNSLIVGLGGSTGNDADGWCTAQISLRVPFYKGSFVSGEQLVKLNGEATYSLEYYNGAVSIWAGSYGSFRVDKETNEYDSDNLPSYNPQPIQLDTVLSATSAQTTQTLDIGVFMSFHINSNANDYMTLTIPWSVFSLATGEKFEYTP